VFEVFPRAGTLAAVGGEAGELDGGIGAIARVSVHAESFELETRRAFVAARERSGDVGPARKLSPGCGATWWRRGRRER
jgi:hypothetical protein